MDFYSLREKYPVFYYHSYNIKENDEAIVIEYEFEIEGLTRFNPRIEILKKNFKFKSIDSIYVQNIVFNMGLVEALSYYKATCAPKVIVKCGTLDWFQDHWFQKLYHLGLGEFRYINNIDLPQHKFMDFKSNCELLNLKEAEDELEGIIIPVGGGKDSNVTLELLKDYRESSLALCIGSKKVSMECARLAGFSDDQIIEVRRILDKKILDLNEQGFLNGHTPFSAIVAFISYLCAYLLGKKYVALSNEDSANETNVEGQEINHQYSKTYEFEYDFRLFATRILKCNVEYFSMLRPITELQIAYLFSKYEKYHKVFKSCNVGSKKEPWHWCCECPKCLFVFTILSPFLYKEKLVDIFGEDLFEKENLLNTFIDLCGFGETKPFECVGTYTEARYAITKTIKNLENENKELPFLLKYYKDNFFFETEELLDFYNEKHNIPEEFEKILKKALFD